MHWISRVGIAIRRSRDQGRFLNPEILDCAKPNHGISGLEIFVMSCVENLKWRLFTALHVMQTWYGEENSVRLSVRLSVRHTRDPWQNGRKIWPDLYTIRKKIYPSFLRRIMVGGERPLLPEILGQPTPVGAKSPIFNQ